MTDQIKGKRIVVTGASSGIGAALIEQLSSQGAHVIGLSRRAITGCDHITVDLKDEDSMKAAFTQIGSCDALINNAGVAHSAKVVSGGLAAWDEMWQVNVRALAYCSHLAVGLFPPQGGQIVNVSSMSGHRVPPSGGFYASTKFAVRAISEALRLELRGEGDLTRVSSVSPGFVDTPLLDIYFAGREDELIETRRSVDFLTPEEVADQIINILKTPLNVEVGDVSMRSVGQVV